jgi:hypothetical protein
VTTSVLGGFALGTAPLGGTWSYTPGTVNFVSPVTSGTYTSGANVTWTFTPGGSGSTQGQYRLRVLNQAGTAVLYDSGWMISAALLAVPAYTFSDGTVYQFELSAIALDGVPTNVALATSVTASSPTATPLATVGQVYEIGLNGAGYMLADSAEGNVQWQRQSAVIEAQRYATGSTPFSQSINHYEFTAWSDWSSGAGQTLDSRTYSVDGRFYDSDGVDVFTTPGRASLLRATAVGLSSGYATPIGLLANDSLWTQTAAKTLTYQTAPGGAGTGVALIRITGTTISDIATDGTYVFAADGSTSGITRVTEATRTEDGTLWSSVKCTSIAWAVGRLCGAYATASTTSNTWTTIAPAGTEEVGGGRITLPAGWSIGKSTGGQGWVWFPASAGNVGAIYRWTPGVASYTPSIAAELPLGVPTALFYYQGQVMVRAAYTTATGENRAVIYRCPVASDGSLTIFKVLELSDTGIDHGPGAFWGTDRFVLFSWQSVSSTNSGLGVIDLSTGGYSRWLKGTSAGKVRSVGTWRARTWFTLDAIGSVQESAATYLTTGTLTTPHDDKGSVLNKVMDEVTVRHTPLLGSETVAVETSIDRGSSYVSLFTVSGAGSTGATQAWSKTAQTVGLRITLTGPGTSTPALSLASVKLHLLSVSERQISVPVRCYDQMKGLNGQPLPGGFGTGATMARLVEALVGTRVLFQDVDWASTGVSNVVDVIGASTSRVGVYDRHVGRQSNGFVVTLTLRSGL